MCHSFPAFLPGRGEERAFTFCNGEAAPRSIEDIPFEAIPNGGGSSVGQKARGFVIGFNTRAASKRSCQAVGLKDENRYWVKGDRSTDDRSFSAQLNL